MNKNINDMNYRLQDFIKYIIPGLYVIFFVFIWSLLSPEGYVDVVKLKDFTGIITLLIPFVGFVVGYFIECLMSCFEHLFYLKGRRPSKIVLGRKCQFYVLSEKDIAKIMRHHGITDSDISNKIAGQILQIAKQSVSREDVESFRMNSILARNIFGGQLVLSIAYTCITPLFYTDNVWYISSIFVIIFCLYWYHHNCVYVKYILAEYAKTIPD